MAEAFGESRKKRLHRSREYSTLLYQLPYRQKVNRFEEASIVTREEVPATNRRLRRGGSSDGGF